MKVSQLYVYPIKSLRGTSVDASTLTRHGFPYDRRYMLAKVLDDVDTSQPAASPRLENMHIAYYPQMSLFTTSLNFHQEDAHGDGRIGVTYTPPKSSASAPSHLEIPLNPETSGLEEVHITMHESPTKAFVMDARYSEWFSSRLGFSVLLLHLGTRHRDVLMTVPSSVQKPSSNTWNLTSRMISVARSVPLLGNYMGSHDNVDVDKGAREVLTFADCAPYLVVSDTSRDAVTSRLSSGAPMDVTKFRPNIVVSGARDAWEEDFWREIRIGGAATVATAQNCVRCVSLNIDYSTGEMGKGEAGAVLKKLMRDRRVDKGAKWSPVFGRYSFVLPQSEGAEIAVGDEVEVVKVGAERTFFDWKSLMN